jgi:hypothetical protein
MRLKVRFLNDEIIKQIIAETIQVLGKSELMHMLMMSPKLWKWEGMFHC